MMNMIFFVFYAIVVITIIVNILKFVKVFKTNNSMFSNIENMVKERYDRVIQNNIFNENTTKTEKEVNLDDFLKSNTNPVKERRGKRSKI